MLSDLTPKPPSLQKTLIEFLSLRQEALGERVFKGYEVISDFYLFFYSLEDYREIIGWHSYCFYQI